jgi:serine/threonine-protein kinase
LEVSAALPGGDPLAAALAAGETPSPEMVAAAGPTEGLCPRVAAMLVVATLASLGVVLTLTPRVMLLGHLPLQHPPEELRIRARDVVRAIGYADEPLDIEAGFRFDAQHAAYLARTAVSSEIGGTREWDRILAPGPWPVYFNYQQTDVRMIRTYTDFGGARGVAAAGLDHIGLISVDVALDGRLLRVVALPRGGRENTGAEVTAPWPALFIAAGLDMSRLEPAPATANVSVADARLAWTGSYADGRPVRVEAASLQGHTTSFAVVFPWSDPARPMAALTTLADTSLTTVLLISSVYIGFALMARHNLKLGRGDTRGAWRVGLYVGVVELVSEVVGGLTRPEWFPISAGPFVAGVIFALAYLAIEPWTRRLWPHVIITWTRVIGGRWRDPLVARDVLAAVTCVSVSYALLRLLQFAALRAGEPPLPPQTGLLFGISLNQLLGGSVMLSTIVRPLASGLWVSVILFFLLFVSYAVLRRKWLAAVVYVALGSVLIFPGAVAGTWINTFQWLLEIGCLLFLTLRFGLLAAAVQSCVSQILSSGALTYRFDEWYGQSSLIATMLVIGLALYGLRMSMKHHPLPFSHYPPRDAAHA